MMDDDREFAEPDWEFMEREPPEIQEPDAVSYFQMSISRRISEFLKSYYSDDSEMTLQQKWNNFTTVNFGR